MRMAVQAVIASKAKQSYGIASSSQNFGTPRNDNLLLGRKWSYGIEKIDRRR
jgi:hypothetical protein